MAKLLRFAVVAWLGFFFPALATAASTSYALTNAFPGLTFTNPVGIASAPEETNRLFIVERKGRIVVITNLAAPNRAIFMDISSRVTSATDTTVGGEEGLLGLAFHPGYATNGFFYVFYTGPATTTAVEHRSGPDRRGRGVRQRPGAASAVRRRAHRSTNPRPDHS